MSQRTSSRHAASPSSRPETCGLAIDVVEGYDRAILSNGDVPGPEPLPVGSLSCTGVSLGDRAGYPTYRVTRRNGTRLVSFDWR